MEKEDEFLFHYTNQIRSLATEYKEKELPQLTEELFALFEQNGNRLKYEEVYFERRKMLAIYGMAAVLFHEKELIQHLISIIEGICEETCWALPAHVNRKQNTNWRHTVDLFASETTQTLAELSALLSDELPVIVRERIHTEIEARVFHPFFTSSVPYGGWEGCTHNWNAVCSGAIGSACMYLMKSEPERLATCLNRICNSIEHYLDGFMEDGTCMEGIGYFTYGMTYYVGFAKQLLDFTQGKMNLFLNPKLVKIAQFQQKMYFTSYENSKTLTVSFSDGEMHAKFRMGLTLFLASLYDQVEIPDILCSCDFNSDTCYRWMALYRDYLWTKESVGIIEHKKTQNRTGNQEKEPSRYSVGKQYILPSAEWCVYESEQGVGLAVKGGNNNEPHNHNDIASFLYQIKGEPMLVDLGAGEYTKDYFSEGRYDILCNSSLGHNVPLINGTLQKAGKEYGTSLFEADRHGTIRIEFQNAYEKNLLVKAERNLKFSVENGSLVLLDVFEITKDITSLTENFVTQCKVTIDHDKIMLHGDREGCSIYLRRTSKTACSPICIHKIHKNHQGVSEEVTLIQWNYSLNHRQMQQKSELSKNLRVEFEFIIEPFHIMR